MTIRKHGAADSLPVLTLADPDRIGRDRAYAESIVVRLFEIFMDIDELRGAGRLYLP
jgi:hypothetical protein